MEEKKKLVAAGSKRKFSKPRMEKKSKRAKLTMEDIVALEKKAMGFPHIPSVVDKAKIDFQKAVAMGLAERPVLDDGVEAPFEETELERIYRKIEEQVEGVPTRESPRKKKTTESRTPPTP